MRNKLKKILFPALCAFLCAATGIAVSAPATANAAKAETTAADLTIKGKTLTVSNNINVSFFIPMEAGDKNDIKVKVVEKENGVTEAEVILTALTDNYTYDGETYYYEYMYKGITPYEFENDLYAYAYLQSDETVQGETVKYSVLQYAYTKLGQTGKAKDTTAGLENLLTSMLLYGSAAAIFEREETDPFSYETAYAYVSLTNAVFEDGFSYGLFKKGAQVTVTANEGYAISDEAHEAFEKTSNTTATLTVPNGYFNDTSSFVDNSANISNEDKVASEAGKVTFALEKAYVGDTEILNTTPETYEDVTISWSATGASIVDNVVTFDTVGTAALTATITCGEESDTKTFNVDVTENPYPVEGKAYALKGSTYYAATPTSTSYLAFTQDSTQALNVYFKESGDVYYMYYMVDETNVKYIEHKSSTSLQFIAGTITDEIPTTCKGWTLDVDVNKIISNVDSGRKLGVNSGDSRISTYGISNTQYAAVWFEEIRELTDAEKVQMAADEFELAFSSINGADSKILPETTEKFNATIAWALNETAYATLDGYTLTTTNPENVEGEKIVLNATFTVGEATATKNLEITVQHVEEGGSNEPVSNTYTADFSCSSSTGTSYKSFITNSGWATTGRNDSSVALESGKKTICLNKVAGTVLTSPTLSTGIKSLSFKYGFAFTDTSMNVSVYIKQNGTTIAEYTINHTVTKSSKTIYTFDTTNLASGITAVTALTTPITGDFTIEIKNNNTSRPSIWDLTWDSYEV